MKPYWKMCTKALGVYEHQVGDLLLLYVTKVPEPYVEVYHVGGTYLFRKVAIFRIKQKHLNN